MQHAVAYHRVSTARQGRSGLGIEAQRAAEHRFALQGQWADRRAVVSTWRQIIRSRPPNISDRPRHCLSAEQRPEPAANRKPGNDSVKPAQEIRQKMLGWFNRRLLRKHVKLLWQNSMALIVMGNAYGIPVSGGQKTPNRIYETRDLKTEQWLRKAIFDHNRMRDAFYDNDISRPLSRDDASRAIDINNGLRAWYAHTNTARATGKSFEVCFEPILSWQEIYENHGVM